MVERSPCPTNRQRWKARRPTAAATPRPPTGPTNGRSSRRSANRCANTSQYTSANSRIPAAPHHHCRLAPPRGRLTPHHCRLTRGGAIAARHFAEATGPKPPRKSHRIKGEVTWRPYILFCFDIIRILLYTLYFYNFIPLYLSIHVYLYAVILYSYYICIRI